jgi:hypothetical protein
VTEQTRPWLVGVLSAGMIVMDDVVVSRDAILPSARGLGGPFSCLNNVSLQSPHCSPITCRVLVYMTRYYNIDFKGLGT